MSNDLHPLDHLTMLSDGEDRDAWLAARADPNLITATQAAAIAGSHPYTKLIDVYNEKTDPNYDAEYLRNAWLEERAELGTEREPEIIAWATADPVTGGPGAPFIPNTRLVEHPDRPGDGCTPDGAKIVPGSNKLILIECKATQTRWDEKGVPQHIEDQMYWQMWTTGAFTVWLAVEFYEWQGRGKNKTPVKVGQMLKPYQQNERRLEHLRAKVAQFRQWLADGIAPESDVFLSTDPGIEFDDTPEEAAEKTAIAAEDARLDALLNEEADIVRELADREKRRKEIGAEVKKITQQYEGRRVHLIGTRRIAKYTRYDQKSVDTSKLDPKVLDSITSWVERDKLVIDPNPEYVEPEAAEETAE